MRFITVMVVLLLTTPVMAMANDDGYSAIYKLDDNHVFPRYYTRTRADGSISVYDLKRSYRTPRYNIRQRPQGHSIYDAGRFTPRYQRRSTP